MKDRNEYYFSGSIESFRRIETRTGTPMISFRAICWKEKISVVAFKTIAEQTELAPGDRVEVRGHIQTTEWTNKDGNRRQGWQVVAHEINKAIDSDTQEKTQRPARQQQAQQGELYPAMQKHDEGTRFAYRGGPF